MHIPQLAVQHGIKTGLAAVVAYALAWNFHLAYALWAPVTAVVVMQQSVAASVVMGVYRSVGTIIGAVFGIVVIVLLPDTPVWNGVGLFLATSICAFLTQWSSRYRMAAITVAVVVLATTGSHDRIAFALDRIMEILIGVACAMLVTILLWPQRVGVQLKDELCRELREAAEAAGTLCNALADGRASLPEKYLQGITDWFSSGKAQMKAVREGEAFLYHYDLNDLEMLRAAVQCAAQHLSAMLCALPAGAGIGYSEYLTPEIRSLCQGVQTALRWLADPQQEKPQYGLQTLVEESDARMAALRAKGSLRAVPFDELVQSHAFYYVLRAFALTLERCVQQRISVQGRARR